MFIIPILNLARMVRTSSAHRAMLMAECLSTRARTFAASCSPTSGALIASVRRVRYRSAPPSPSSGLRFAPSGGRCLAQTSLPGIGEVEHVVRLLAVVHGPRPLHPICGSACTPSPGQQGSCSPRSSHRSSGVLVLLGIRAAAPVLPALIASFCSFIALLGHRSKC
jgi:hypothetical protein